MIRSNFELIDCPCELDTKDSVRNQSKILLQFDESSKFGFRISYVKITILQKDLRMLSWNWNIGDSDFTLMSSSDFDWIILLSRNEMQASFLFVLLLVVDTLQKYVRLVWLWNGHHFKVFRVVTDYLRKRAFTDLALKFGKIVALGNPLDFLFYFTVDPSSKATNMYHSAAALTIARRNQRIIFSFLVTKTNFAVSFPLLNSFVMFASILLHFKDSISLLKVISIS